MSRALAVACTLCVLAATLAPAGGAPTPVPDWALHAAGFGVLAAAYARALDGRILAAFALAVLLGAGIELVQPLVGRTRSASDLLANAAGAALVVSFLRLRHEE